MVSKAIALALNGFKHHMDDDAWCFPRRRAWTPAENEWEATAVDTYIVLSLFCCLCD